MKKSLAIGSLVILLSAGFISGVILWKKHIKEKQLSLSLNYASEYLEKGFYKETLRLVDARRSSLNGSELSETWKRLELEASRNSNNLPRLYHIYTNDPILLLEDEKACLSLARSFIHQKNSNECLRILDYWANRSKDPHLWLAIKVDNLLMAGKKNQAKQILISSAFEGPADIGRLTRLAILEGENNLDRAWELLKQAEAKDRQSPDVHSFKGQLLESSGFLARAHAEYLIAYNIQPGNILYADQLTEFYIRNKNYDQAIQLMDKLLSERAYPSISLKRFFWTKVVSGDLRSISLDNASQSEVSPLASTLKGISTTQFWNQDLFSSTSDTDAYLGQNQEFYWLRLLEKVRLGDLYNLNSFLIKYRSKPNLWDPELEFLLAAITAKKLNIWDSSLSVKADALLKMPQNSVHSMTRRICSMVLDQKVLDPIAFNKKYKDLGWIKSDWAYGAALFARGWFNAGNIMIEKCDKDSLLNDLPPDISYIVLSGIRKSSGVSIALSCFGSHSTSPILTLLKGEMLLEAGRLSDSIKTFSSILGTNHPASLRSTWILATLYLERERIQDAEKIINSTPAFIETNSGKEMMAKIYLAKNQDKLAVKIYEEIADQSMEAMVYLAHFYKESNRESDSKKMLEKIRHIAPDRVQVWEHTILNGS